MIRLLSFTLLCFCCENKDNSQKEILELKDKQPTVATQEKKLSEAFKEYWYQGQAEITSFELEQERYGEMRKGKAVLVYVTEDFLPQKQVKANTYNSTNIPVLKLNATKNFNTGIYPYSILESTFFPLKKEQYPLKMSSSVQEWCGHTYTQLNHKDQYEISSHSYFEGEADQNFKIDKALTENEIWARIRVDPKRLPTAGFMMVPSLAYLKMNHKDIKTYEAFAIRDRGLYVVNYPGLKRTLSIVYNPEFPHDIISWSENSVIKTSSGEKNFLSKASRLNLLKTDYWNKNSNKDQVLRSELKLD